MRRLTPIVGFGWGGWALAPISLVLAAVFLSGYDAFYRVQVFVAGAWGAPGLDRFMGFYIFTHMSLWKPVCGPLTLLYLLPALWLMPRRRTAVPLVVITAWALVRPVLAGPALHLWYGWLGVPARMTSDAAWLCTDISLDLVTAILVGVATGSWRVGLAFMLLVGGAWTAIAWVPAYGTTANMVIPRAWHAATAVLLLVWAIYARRSAFPEGACQGCGYDLAGNTSGVCPECGREIAPSAVPAAAA